MSGFRETFVIIYFLSWDVKFGILVQFWNAFWCNEL